MSRPVARLPGVRWLGVALAGVVLVAGVLRFWGIGHQSFWFDEVATALVIKGSLWHTLHMVRVSESTPPLYYVLAWAWTHVFGSGEVGLRSLSAVCGIATVLVMWVALRESVSEPAGLVGAALVAVNPMQVWFSQEARTYELVALLGAISFLFMLRIVREPTRRSLVGWSVAACLGLTAHYFAVFLIVGEFAVILWVMRDRVRSAVVALVPVLIVGLALVPLAHAQEHDGRTAWIAGTPIGERLGEVARELVSANTSMISSNSLAPGGIWGLVGIIGVGIALGCGLASREWRINRAVQAAWFSGTAAIVIALLLALTPLDYFKDRNLIMAWIPLFALLATAIALTTFRVAALGAAVCMLLAGLAVDISVQQHSRLQRTNWREAAHLIGRAAVARALIIDPNNERAALEYYDQPAGPMPPDARIRALAIVSPSVPVNAQAPRGFVAVLRRRLPGLTVLRFSASHPVTITPAALAKMPDRLLLQLGPNARQWIADYIRTHPRR
jgi:4-amino-4-deoxy-L-arabinose transferase-like glycosyltransferase